MAIYWFTGGGTRTWETHALYVTPRHTPPRAVVSSVAAMGERE